MELFTTRVFAESASIMHSKEQDAYVYFRDLLEELEGNNKFVACIDACTVELVVTIRSLTAKFMTLCGCRNYRGQGRSHWPQSPPPPPPPPRS